jgi:hypothetical protein
MSKPLPDLQDLLRLLAEQAERRAERRAASLPVLAQMGGAAIAAELELRAVENEAVLRAIGIERTSILRQVASSVPGASQAVGRDVVAADRGLAEILTSISQAGQR